MTRVARAALALLLLVCATSCGKFQQARECASFVKMVNGWLASPDAKIAADAGAANDATSIARDARRTADHYGELSRNLGGLHVQSEELAPRVQRYRAIADDAARNLREVADAIEHGDLEKARQKRVDFDTVAQREPALVQEINGVCR